MDAFEAFQQLALSIQFSHTPDTAHLHREAVYKCRGLTSILAVAEHKEAQ